MDFLQKEEPSTVTVLNLWNGNTQVVSCMTSAKWFVVVRYEETVKMSRSKAQTIQQQNDRFRNGDASIPGTVVVTIGVKALLEEADIDLSSLATAVQEFDEFTEDNDPHDEHDFGKFCFADADMFWKIDQYNSTYDGGSEDPTDLTKACRVLTIMLTHES